MALPLFIASVVPILIKKGADLAADLIRTRLTPRDRGSGGGQTILPFTPGAEIEVVATEDELIVGPDGQFVTKSKRRRRRRRLLTCGDKADIAFLKGTLGSGTMGQTAISAVLARCS